MDLPSKPKPIRDLPPVNTRVVLGRLYRCMISFRGLFLTMILLLILSLASDLIMPLVIESAINTIGYSYEFTVDFRALTFNILMIIGLAVLNTGLGIALGRISSRITLKMSMRLRQDAFQKLMNVSVMNFEKMRRGDLMSRIMNDSDLAAGAFTDSFRELFSSLLVIVGCAVIMFVKCASLAAISVGTAIISVIITGALSGIILPAFIQQQTSLGQMNAHVEESLKTFRSCTIGGRTKENLRLMHQYSKNYYEKRLKACRLEYLMGPVMLLFGNLNFLLTIVFGVRQMAAGLITLGAVQAFIMLSRQFMEPLNSMGENFVMVQNALAGAERIFAIIDMEDEKTEITGARPSEMISRKSENLLELHDVSFAYHKNHPVLRGINLQIKKGERLALVGKTGEGKTTLTSLLLLFYPRYSGAVSIGDKELRFYEPEEMRKQITIVSQDPQLLEGSIYKNMTYGCENATREDAEQILRKMGAERFFQNLPYGLDTEINNITESMSQGQLQLICLVRALLRNTPVLILDEATASMDPETEMAVKRGMELIMKGRTCIIIAHRLSSVQDADRIAVLADGTIAECGTHDALMQKKGIYRKLFETQFLGKEI